MTSINAQVPARTSETRIGYFLIISLLVMVAIGKAIIAGNMDPDAFWHMRVAEQLLHSPIGPIVDDISFSSMKSPWTPYSWLAELFMRWIFVHGGYQSTMIITAICGGGIIALNGLTNVLQSPKSNAGKPSFFTAILTTILTCYFTLAFISFRPVSFALLLFALIIYLLYRDRSLNYRSQAVWLVPTLTLVQTNLHLYSIFSVGVAVFLAMGSYTNCRKRFLRNGCLAVATMIAACCTPMLMGAIETSFRYQNYDPMIANRFIAEMAPFHAGFGGKISVSIVTLLLCFAIYNFKKLQITDWLLIGFGLLVLSRLGRFAPVFSIITMPIFTRVLPELPSRTLGKRFVHLALSIVLIFGLGNIALSIPSRQTSFNHWLNRLADDIGGFPTDVSDWAEQNITPRSNRILNEFNWGGYLSWRFKDRQVLLDGRTQLYTPDFWKKIYFGTPESQKQILSDASADFAILPAKRSAFKQSLEELGWQIKYEDKIALVMTKN